MNNIVQDTQAKYQAGEPAAAKRIVIEGMKAAAPDELLELGAIAKQYSDYEAANAAYAQLVQTAPDNPDYRNHYAVTLIQTGDFDGAEKHITTALSINDAHAHSYFNLSMIHRATVDDAVIAKLENRLRVPDISPADNYAYRMALGKFYDDTGDYDNAFAQFQAAKQSAPINYDHVAQQTYFDSLKSGYTVDFIKQNSGSGDPSPAPVFIVGMPRSGSSLIEQMLGQDKRIVALGERIEMTLVIQQMVSRQGSGGIDFSPSPDSAPEEFTRCGADYQNRLAALSGDAERYIDKNVLNFLRAGFINLILPNATIIHARRDPIDICLSCYFQSFDPAVFPFTFNLEDVGKYYALYADLMVHWESVMPDRLTNVDYEKFIGEPDASINALLEQTKLSAPLQADGADADQSMVATSSAWQARQPIYETSIKRWKNYEKHLAPLFAALEQSSFQYPGA